MRCLDLKESIIIIWIQYWKIHEDLLAFKFLEDEHDRKSLLRAMIEGPSEYEIVVWLQGDTAGYATKNSTMMQHLEEYY
jgi:hypothetical protein